MENSSKLYTQQVPAEDLTCVTFVIDWPLSHATSNVFHRMFVLDSHMKCIVHGLLSRDSSLICKKCCHVFTHRYTLDDDSECPMDYETSLLLNIFPSPTLSCRPTTFRCIATMCS